MELHRADAPTCGLVDLLLALQAPIVGIAGGPGVLLAGRDLLVIQIQFRAIAPYNLHGFLSTKDKVPGYSFSRSRRWKTAAAAISALFAAPRHARVLPLRHRRSAHHSSCTSRQKSCIILWGQLLSGGDKVLPVPVAFKDKAVSLGFPAYAPITRCQRSKRTRSRHVRPCARQEASWSNSAPRFFHSSIARANPCSRLHSVIRPPVSSPLLRIV